MENNKKEYIALRPNDFYKIEKVGRTIFEDKLRNDTNSIIMKSTKAAVANILDSKSNKVDFTLMCGRVAFLVDKKAALDILKFQKKCIYEIETTSPLRSHKVYDLIARETLKYIKDNHKDSFSGYALVDLYDITKYVGPYYGVAETADDSDFEDILSGRKTYASGMINTKDFTEKLKTLGYMEGVNAYDASINDPIEFIKESMCEADCSYFGFAIPYTKEAFKGKKKSK